VAACKGKAEHLYSALHGKDHFKARVVRSQDGLDLVGKKCYLVADAFLGWKLV